MGQGEAAKTTVFVVPICIAAVYAARGEGLQRADCVEKLQISDAAFFRKEPVIPKSQMRSAIGRIELAHERQKTNLAEPFALKSWLRCTDKNFADFAKNGVFQQYQPRPTKLNLFSQMQKGVLPFR